MNAVIFPDLVDSITVTQASAPVTGMISATAGKSAGQVTFVKMVSGGANYTYATVSFAGTGTGATAGAFISGGKIIGIYMTTNGSGYGAGTTILISGDGTGATASVQIGLPVLQNRRLAINCQASVEFAAAGSSPNQANWTGSSITVPAGASIDWMGVAGGWQATRFIQ